MTGFQSCAKQEGRMSDPHRLKIMEKRLVSAGCFVFFFLNSETPDTVVVTWHHKAGQVVATKYCQSVRG